MKTRTILKVALWAVCIFAVQRFCHKQTDGFAREKISSSHSFHSEWETPPLSEQETEGIKQLLSQKFTYLGKGAQSYVFESEDKQAVIKFFRHSHMRPPFWLFYCPFKDFREEKIAQHYAKLFKDFESYKIANEVMKEESGLLFLHLNKTRDLQQKLTIYDKIGIKHELDLDQMEFLVQRKATLIYPALANWIEHGEIASAKNALTSLIALLELRCKKGISDKDPDLNTNFGFIGETPVQIDIGRFKRDQSRESPEVYKAEILRITENLKQWLDSHSQELSEHFQKELAAL